MSYARLPAHLEIAALIRAAEAKGGFATVLNKGERDAGVILLLSIEPDGHTKLWERMPRLDGKRVFEAVRERDSQSPQAFDDSIARRIASDRDVWVLELCVADAQRFIADFAA